MVDVSDVERSVGKTVWKNENGGKLDRMQRGWMYVGKGNELVDLCPWVERWRMKVEKILVDGDNLGVVLSVVVGLYGVAVGTCWNE